MSHIRETTLTFFVMYISPLTSEVYLLVNLFIPRHTIVAGYYGFTLVVRESVRRTSVHPSIFCFRMIT